GKILMDEEILEAMNELRELLFGIVYTNPIAKGEEVRAEEMLAQMYDYYLKRPELLPDVYAVRLSSDGEARCVADYISGMTDRFAISAFKELFIPKVWQGPSE
ncbi:MAG: deoxyguanosinetriphosphate triphosphohydrolase, partial [Clostridia bacterium]|nr:deoxyguanosinetriphosphate triphosphohydrolase [Clostridia bacterium]